MKREKYDLANSTFERLSTEVSNARLLSDQVKKIYLRKSVIVCLQRIGREGLGINWWQDTKLMSIFQRMYEAGVLPLPVDPVERIRWIALICARACEFDGLNCDELVNELDYLPTIGQCKDRNQDRVDRIKEIRRILKQNGWKSVFGW